MSEKRRGLGRGLGALIPTAPAVTKPGGDSPVDDVFFPGREESESARTAPAGTAVATADGAAAVIDIEARSRTAVRDAPPAGAKKKGTATSGAPGGTSGAAASGSARGSANAPGTATAGSATRKAPGGAAGGAAGDGSRVPEQAPERLPEPAAAESGLVPVPGAEFAELPVEAISPNPRQPRQVFDEESLAELVHSIREIGVLQPVVVRRTGEDADGPRYQLIMGERRLRATKAAGLDRIPAIVRETSDDDLLRDALLENLHRAQLNPLEEAAAYQQLLDDFGCTHEDLAGRIGRSRPQISNTLRLLRLPPLVQRRVAAGVLSAGHARALLGLEDPGSMERLAQRIVAEGLSVRAVEEIVALGDGIAERPAKRRPRSGSRTGELDNVASRLGDHLETRVAIALGKNRGRLTIDFASVDDLNRIVGLMAPEVRGAFDS